jgi:hypothetical protein
MMPPQVQDSPALRDGQRRPRAAAFALRVTRRHSALKRDRQNMIFVILLILSNGCFDECRQKGNGSVSGENFQKLPVIFPVLREFDPCLFSLVVGWVRRPRALPLPARR